MYLNAMTELLSYTISDLSSYDNPQKNALKCGHLQAAICNLQCIMMLLVTNLINIF